MKAALIGVFLVVCLQFDTLSQVEIDDQSSFTDRIYTGGGMGFNFSRDVFSVSISPIVGYMITDRLSAGIGIVYQYTNIKVLDVSTDDYGARLFGRYNLTQQLFAYTEYEYLNFEFINLNDINDNFRQDFSSYLAGLGYVLPLGRSAAINVMGLYNFAWQENKASPYDSPWVVRAGATISF